VNPSGDLLWSTTTTAPPPAFLARCWCDTCRHEQAGSKELNERTAIEAEIITERFDDLMLLRIA